MSVWIRKDRKPGDQVWWRDTMRCGVTGNKYRVFARAPLQTRGSATEAEAQARVLIGRIGYAAWKAGRGAPEPPEPSSTPEPSKPSKSSKPTIATLIERLDAKEKAAEKLARESGEYPELDSSWGTRRTRMVRLRKHIEPYFGRMAADAVHQEDLNAFIGTLKGAPQSRKNVCYALLAVIRMAAEFEIASKAEAVSMHSLRVTVPERVKVKLARKLGDADVEAVTPANVAKLVKAAKDPTLVVAILLAAECGLRAGEILGAKRSDIADGWIKIQRSIDDRGNEGPPKNGCSREVPLSPATLRAIKRLPMRSFHLITLGQEHASYSGINKAIKRIYTRAGVRYGRLLDENQKPMAGKTINVWHSLRHTYGTTLVNDGIGENRVMLLMGHADYRTTQRYVTTTREQLARDVRKAFG